MPAEIDPRDVKMLDAMGYSPLPDVRTIKPECYYQDSTGIHPKHGEHAARHFRAFFTGFLYGAWDRGLGAVVFYDRDAAYIPQQ